MTELEHRLTFRHYILRGLCNLGLHFMNWDARKDGYYCNCGSQFLYAETIRWD